jgi:hypothetical protein
MRQPGVPGTPDPPFQAEIGAAQKPEWARLDRCVAIRAEFAGARPRTCEASLVRPFAIALRERSSAPPR